LKGLPSGSQFCEEKVRLVAEYAAAVTALLTAVSELERSMIAKSAKVYQDRYDETESARHLVETARKELKDHVSGHNC
jgi:hypothetical protein